MTKYKNIIFIFSIILFLYGCSAKKSSQGYQIGVDPTWYPLNFTGRETNVLAFSIELLQEIAKKEDLQLSIVSMNWNNLVWGLTTKKYDAILSSIYPYVFYEKKFHFSNVYLPTGPVIVVPEQSKIKKLDDLKGKRVGILQGSPAALFLQKYPDLLLQSYDTMPETLNALENMYIDTAVLDVLPAQSYVRDLYSGKLKILSPPLNDQGLRLITLDTKKEKLVDKFNSGLKKLQKNGRYEELLKKWGLSDSKATADVEQNIELFLKSFVL